MLVSANFDRIGQPNPFDSHMFASLNKLTLTARHQPSLVLRLRPKAIGQSIRFLAALVIGCGCLGFSVAAQAQDVSAKTNTAPSLKESSLEEVQRQYNQATEELRSSLKELQASSVRFFNESVEQSEVHRESWQQAVDSGKVHVESLRAAAMELFRRQERPSDEVIDLAFRSGLIEINEERYRVGLDVFKRANSIRPTPRTETFMARVQLLDNEFESAKSYFDKHLDQLESLTKTEAYLFESIDELISQFKRERQLREAEAKANDLPRVELLTTEGRIVLELFENEAPETVANFVYLVEQGFYNGVIFHKVKREFVAQAGGFGVAQVDGVARLLPRRLRYTINDENDKPVARKHFRGSLSMANQNAPNTASGQFFLSLTPQPFLNEKHTVFGRVIEGLSVMADLTVNFRDDDQGKEEPVEGTVPSMIQSAKVIRKRDHDYQPVQFGSTIETSAAPATDTKTPAD